MKWLPHFYREKMEQWFTKGDTTWHESTLFKRVESGEVQKLTVTHVADESEHASTQVQFTMSDLLKKQKHNF